MFRTRVDDRQLAQHIWVDACSQCRELIDPVRLKVQGHCPNCGHRRSGLRLMNKKERRLFLAGKLRAYYVTRNSQAGLKTANYGMDSLQTDERDWLRHAVGVETKKQNDELLRRETIIKKDDPVKPIIGVPRKFVRWMRDFGRKA